MEAGGHGEESRGEGQEEGGGPHAACLPSFTWREWRERGEKMCAVLTQLTSREASKVPKSAASLRD